MASEQDDVLVLGGGFAGLSCAVALAGRGKKVLVLEKKPHLGGRAYSFEESGLDVDNGQHLFMGCYRATRRFLKAIGTESRLDIYQDIVVDYAEPGGKKDRLACPSWLPAPLHLAAGLMGLKGVPLRDKAALIAFDESLKSMKKGEIPAAIEKLTVRQWLTSLGLSPVFQTRFFDPAAIGILNDKPDVASAAGFVQALREMFFTGRESSRFALAKTGLSDLYTEAARDYIEKRGGRVISTAKVAGLIESGGRVRGAVTDMGSRFEARHTVSTLPPWDLKKLALPAAVRGPWEMLAPAPIVGATLKLDRPVMDERFVGMLNTETHWVFNKTKIHGLNGEGQTIAVVISGAHAEVGYSPEKIMEIAKRDLSSCLPDFAKAKILASKVVKEPFATLSPVPGAEALRPLPGSGMDGFAFAGDWTRTGFPATIESACVSGERAAESLLA
ncbi:MAG TPA: hydroxysqualene dehydroxylase HpnE [Elusimicrobiota bacterium]|nr:hydroxysqualene dehydroxylase HpnE [Elusimicrobiota bacterium]